MMRIPFSQLSIFALALAALMSPGCGSETPPTAELSSVDASSDAQDWWAALGADEQNAMMLRMQEMRTLADGDREEIRQRASYAGDQMRAIRSSLSPEEHRHLMSLPPDDRRRFMQERVKTMMVARSDEICSTGGCGDNTFDKLALPDRFKESKRIVSEKRKPRAIRALDQALASEQITATEASALREAPVEEVVAILGDLRKREMIASADAHDFWNSCGVSAEQKETIVGLEPKLFVRAIMMLRAGVPSDEVCERCLCEMENCAGMDREQGQMRSARPPQRGANRMQPGRGRNMTPEQRAKFREQRMKQMH